MNLLTLNATANGRTAYSAPLTYLAILSACSLIGGLIGCLFFDKYQAEHQAWITLAKFGASLCTYAVTMQWMMPYIRRHPSLVLRSALAAAAGAMAVLFFLFLHAFFLSLLPTWQSQFSIFTSLARVAIIPPTLFILVAFKAVLSDNNSPTALRRGLLWATGLAILGCVPAVLMLMPDLMHASALNVLAAKHAHEALKLSHFTGLHALQIMPICCWLVSMKGASLSRQLEVIDSAGAMILSLIVLLAIKGILNEAIVAPGILTSMIVAVVTLTLCKLFMVFYGPPLPRKT